MASSKNPQSDKLCEGCLQPDFCREKGCVQPSPSGDGDEPLKLAEFILRLAGKEERVEVELAREVVRLSALSSTRREVLGEAAEICSSRGYIHRGVNDALSKEAFDCMADIMALAESPRPEAVTTWACGWAGERCLRMGCTKQHPCSGYTPSPRGEPTPACTSPTGVCLSPRACDYHGKCKNSTL